MAFVALFLHRSILKRRFCRMRKKKRRKEEEKFLFSLLLFSAGGMEMVSLCVRRTWNK